MLTWTIAGAVGALVLAYLIFIGVRALRVAAEKRQVRGAFARYLSPELVEQLADNPDRLTLGSEIQEMSIMFCGIAHYDELSFEFGSDLHELHAFLTRFNTKMGDQIVDANGTINRFIAHRSTSFWGAPLEDDKHAFNACDCAIAMNDALKEFNEDRAKEAQENGKTVAEVKICIGIESGDCHVGNFGSPQRFDYTAIGGPVDVAGELEKLAVKHGVGTLIGQGTQQQATDYAVIEIDDVTAEGENATLPIFALLGDAKLGGTEQFQNLKRCHDEFLSAYREDRRADARARLEDCRAVVGNFELSGLYDFYETQLDAMSA